MKTLTRNVAHKAAEGTDKFLGNKIVDKIVKPKTAPNENLKVVKKIIVTPENREEIVNELRQVL